MKKFAIAILADRDMDTGELYQKLGLIIENAHSEAEAIGLGHIELEKYYSKNDGWNHSVWVKEVL